MAADHMGGLQLDKVVHKTKIVLNEKGAKSAAATTACSRLYTDTFTGALVATFWFHLNS